jgi:hypothetical protein
MLRPRDVPLTSCLWDPPRVKRQQKPSCWNFANGTTMSLSAATFDEHEGDTITEHHFVNVLSPSCSSW